MTAIKELNISPISVAAQTAPGSNNSLFLSRVSIMAPLKSIHPPSYSNHKMFGHWMLFTLRDGDTIYIPTRANFNVIESLHLAAASFAADENRPVNVAVVDEVLRPGSYTASRTSANSAGNGMGAVTFGTGLPTVTQGDSNSRRLLQNKDIIVVGRSGTAALSDALDNVVRPLRRAFSLFTIPASIFNLFD